MNIIHCILLLVGGCSECQCYEIRVRSIRAVVTSRAPRSVNTTLCKRWGSITPLTLSPILKRGDSFVTWPRYNSLFPRLRIIDQLYSFRLTTSQISTVCSALTLVSICTPLLECFQRIKHLRGRYVAPNSILGIAVAKRKCRDKFQEDKNRSARVSLVTAAGAYLSSGLVIIAKPLMCVNLAQGGDV